MEKTEIEKGLIELKSEINTMKYYIDLQDHRLYRLHNKIKFLQITIIILGIALIFLGQHFF